MIEVYPLFKISLSKRLFFERMTNVLPSDISGGSNDCTNYFGSEVSSQIKKKVSEKIAHYLEQGKRNPGLAVILVGNDPASQVYVGSKRKSCAEIGIASKSYDLPEETTEAELLALIEKLNQDDSVDGILVQLPLPKQIRFD